MNSCKCKWPSALWTIARANPVCSTFQRVNRFSCFPSFRVSIETSLNRKCPIRSSSATYRGPTFEKVCKHLSSINRVVASDGIFVSVGNVAMNCQSGQIYSVCQRFYRHGTMYYFPKNAADKSFSIYFFFTLTFLMGILCFSLC